MRNLTSLIAGAALLAASATAMLPTAASAFPVVAPAAIAPAPLPIEASAYVYGGRRYCFYDAGWRGPGFYLCGRPYARGFFFARGFFGRGGVHRGFGFHHFGFRHGGFRHGRRFGGFGHRGRFGHHGGGHRGGFGHHGGGHHGGFGHHGGGHHGGGGPSRRRSPRRRASPLTTSRGRPPVGGAAGPYRLALLRQASTAASAVAMWLSAPESWCSSRMRPSGAMT